MKTLFVSNERVMAEADASYRFEKGDVMAIHYDSDDLYEVMTVAFYLNGLQNYREPTLVVQLVPYIEEGT